MEAVDVTKALAHDPPKNEYTGRNFVGIAYAKAPGRSDTKATVGSKARAPYQGKFGVPGGRFQKIPFGTLFAAFSGGTGARNSEISEVGMKAFELTRGRDAER